MAAFLYVCRTIEEGRAPIRSRISGTRKDSFVSMMLSLGREQVLNPKLGAGLRAAVRSWMPRVGSCLAHIPLDTGGSRRPLLAMFPR